MSPYELTKRDEEGTVVHEEYESTGHRVVRYIPHAIAAGTAVAISFGALGILAGPGGLAAILTGGEPGSVPGAFEYSAPNAPTVDLLWIDTSTVRAIGTVFAGSGDAAHDSTQVQLDRYGADFSAPLIDSISGAVTTDTLQSNDSIKADTLYSVRMRYKADPGKGDWSAWSDTAAGTATISPAPDQVIDWGLYTDYDDAASSDSMLSQIGTENTNSVTIVDSLPSPNDFAGTYNGSYMTRMWSQMAAPGIAGFNVEIPNAWSVSTRVIYERFYLMFNRQYQGTHNGDSLFNMAAGSCAGSGSSGLKTSLWQWWSADQTSSGTRSDFIVRDGDISINHANNEPFSGSYNSDAMLDGEWHLVELAFDPGSFGANGEAKYEMWVDDNMVHAIPHPFADRDGLVNDSYRLGHSAWTDTFNCEEEFALYAAGDTLTVIVSPIERWWSAVPGWYTAKPSNQKYDGN